LGKRKNRQLRYSGAEFRLESAAKQNGSELSFAFKFINISDMTNEDNVVTQISK
jgi:hypothetical protein